MGKWERKTVGEINNYKGKSVNPLNAPNQTYELYSVPSWDNNYPEIIKGSEIGSTKQIVEKDDVLLCKINPRINRVWIVQQHTEYPLIASSEWIIVRNKAIDSRYLSKYFQSPLFRNMMISEQSGIGGSLTRAQPKRVSAYPVPLPSLPTQQKIADVLDRASALIEKRKAQIDKLDLLIKSQFIEMFGDPVTNPKGWEIKPLRSIICSLRYGTSTPPSFSVNGYSFIRATNIKKGAIVPEDMCYIDEKEANKFSKCQVKAGEMIIVRSGVNSGDTCVISDEYNGHFAGYDIIITPDRRQIDSVFLNVLMNTNYMQVIIKPLTRRAAQPHLNAEQVNGFSIILPPLVLQTEFAAFVQQIEAQKSLLQQSLAELELNHKSLMRKCFKEEMFNG